MIRNNLIGKQVSFTYSDLNLNRDVSGIVTNETMFSIEVNNKHYSRFNIISDIKIYV